MPILDRYLIQLQVGFSKIYEILLIGYFDNYLEYQELVSKLLPFIKEPGRLDYSLQSLKPSLQLIVHREGKIEKSGHVEMGGESFRLDSRDACGELFKMVEPKEPNNHRYWVTFSTSMDVDGGKMVLGYFSAINELYEIAKQLGGLAEPGSLSIEIEDLRNQRKLTSRFYEVTARHEIVLSDGKHHLIDLKNPEQIKELCLYIWESDFTD